MIFKGKLGRKHDVYKRRNKYTCREVKNTGEKYMYESLRKFFVYDLLLLSSRYLFSRKKRSLCTKKKSDKHVEKTRRKGSELDKS